MDSGEFYKAVYDQDNPRGDAHGWIQWKGTDVCMDLHCKCGHHGHIDAGFFYNYECAKCGRKYAVGQNVKLIELTPDQAQHVEQHGVGFTKDETTPANASLSGGPSAQREDRPLEATVGRQKP